MKPRSKIGIGALFGVLLGLMSLGSFEDRKEAFLPCILFGASFGALSVAILVRRDARRRRNPAWREEVGLRARALLESGDVEDPERAESAAEADLIDSRPGRVTVGLMILGGVSMLCGIIMGVVKVLDWVRAFR